MSNYGKALSDVSTDVAELAKLTKGLTEQQTINILSTKNLAKEELLQVLANNQIVGSEAEVIASKITTAAANNTATFSLGAYTTAIWANIKALGAWMLTNPVGWITAIGVAFVGVTRLIDLFTESLEEQKEDLNEIKKEYNDLQDEIKSLNDQINTNINTITELQEKANNGTITLVESDQLKKLKLQNDLLNQQLDVKEKLAEQSKKELIPQNIKTFVNEFGGSVDNAFQDNSTIREYHAPGLTDYKRASDKELVLYAMANKSKLNEAIANQDAELQKALEEEEKLIVSELDKRSGTILSSLLEYQDNLSVNMVDGKFENEIEQQVWDSIESWKKAIYQYSNSSGDWNTLKIKTVLDDESLDGTMEELIKKFEDGTLTGADILKHKDLATALFNADLILEDGNSVISVFLQYLREVVEVQKEVNKTKPDFTFNETSNKLIDDYQSELSSLSETLDKLRNGDLSSVELTDLFQEFPELMGKTDNLSDAIQTLIDDKLKTLRTELKKLGASDEFLAMFDDMTNKAKTVQLDEILSDLESTHSAIKELKKEISETGNISVTTLQNIIKEYPGLEDVVNDYLLGKLEEKDVLQALQEEYDTDLHNYYLYIAEKKGEDINFYNAIRDSLSDDLIAKAKQYGIDLVNYKTYLEAKAGMDKQYTAKKAKLLVKTDMYESAEKDISKDPLNPWLYEKQEKALGHVVKSQKEVADVEKIIEDFDTTVELVMPDFTTNLNFKPDTGNEDKEFSEDIDWIARSVENAQKKVDDFDRAVSQAEKFTDRIDAYDDLKDANDDLVAATEIAVGKYEDIWENSYKGVDQKYIDLVTGGEIKKEDLKIENFNDEDEYNKVMKMIDAYDNLQSMKSKHQDALDKREADEDAINSLYLERAQLNLDTLNLAGQSTMSVKEKIDWLEQEKLAKEEILNYDLLLIDSEEERLLKQKEYAQFLAKNEEDQYQALRSERASRAGYFGTQIEDIQNAIALEEAKGGQGREDQYLGMNTLLDKKIEVYTTDYNEALAKRNAADPRTDAWYQYNQEIQEAQNNINECKIAQIENNKAIKLLPVKQYEDANKALEKNLELVTKQREKVESGISYASTYVQNEIDALNEIKKERTKHYEDIIKPLEEQKEALSESNDELERSIALENAKYALEKAKQNRTVRVYRKGEGFVYEADQEEVRSAQQELDSQIRENEIANLDKQINNLNKEKEDEFEIIDDKIELWEEYAKKIEKVNNFYDEHIALQNLITQFGVDAKSKLESRDTSIIYDFGVALTDIRIQEDNLQQQIDANNLKIQTIQAEAEAYVSGAQSVVTARQTIDEAVKANEDEIKSLETTTGAVNTYKQAWTDTEVAVKESLDKIGIANVEAKDVEKMILTERADNLEIFKDLAVAHYKEISTALSSAKSAYKEIQTILSSAKTAYADALEYVRKANEAKASVQTTSNNSNKNSNNKSSNKNSSNKNTSTKNNQVYDFQSDLIDIYHDGGIVGKTPQHNIPEHLIALTDTNLKPNETFAKLLNGEVVLNDTQMGNMFNNLNRAYSALLPLNKRESSPMSITVGDVNVYNPENTDMIVNEIVKELPLKVVQRLYSK